jgi:hypothetical protein
MARSHRLVLLALVLFGATPILHANIVGDALLYLPANTEYLEYDNLAALRTLPAYNSLRQNFAGKPLEDAKAVLAQLGIQETQVQELVTGSRANTYYGLISGTFSGDAVPKNPANRRLAAKLLDTEVYCTGRDICIVFLENALAAFGPMNQLKQIVLAREGHLTGLNASSHASQLIQATDHKAPVRGMMFGAELQSGVASFLGDWGAWKSEQARLTATISGLAYSVTFHDKAHLGATVECTSAASAAMLSHVLSAVSSLQSIASPKANSSTGLPFQNVSVSSSGNMIHFQGDTAIPALTR